MCYRPMYLGHQPLAKNNDEPAQPAAHFKIITNKKNKIKNIFQCNTKIIPWLWYLVTLGIEVKCCSCEVSISIIF